MIDSRSKPRPQVESRITFFDLVVACTLRWAASDFIKKTAGDKTQEYPPLCEVPLLF